MMPEQNNTAGPGELYLDVRLLNNLSDTARWGKVLAVLGFILSGAILLFGVFMQQLLEAPEAAEKVANVGYSGFTMVVYAFVALVYFFPSLYLYTFSARMQLGVQQRNRQLLYKAVSKLKILFKFLVIMLILFLLLLGLSLWMLATGVTTLEI